MISFDLSTHVYRPLKQVFRFVSTPENDFQWQYGTFASARISNAEMGLGTLFRAVSHFMGQRMESIFEVTGFEPNKKYGFKSLSGPIDSQTLYTFEIRQGSTEINLATRIILGNFLQPNVGNAEKRVKKQYRENLALLKNILETTQVERSP